MPLEMSEKYDSFIFLTGDGDMKTLYERLLKRKKQIVVVYMYGHLRREIWQIKRGVYKIPLKSWGI